MQTTQVTQLKSSLKEITCCIIHHVACQNIEISHLQAAGVAKARDKWWIRIWPMKLSRLALEIGNRRPENRIQSVETDRSKMMVGNSPILRESWKLYQCARNQNSLFEKSTPSKYSLLKPTWNWPLSTLRWPTPHRCPTWRHP